MQLPDQMLAKTIFPPRLLPLLGILILAVPLLTGQGVIPLPDIISPWLPVSFAAFHEMTEMFAVLVAVLVFSTGFHIPEEKRPLAPIVLAAAFLGVGLLDFFHLLSYPGLADFLTPNTPHKTLVFWLAARLLAAGAMVVYVLLPATPLPAGRLMRPFLLAATLAYTFFWGYVGIWRSGWVPLTYDPSLGLTNFKIGAEWGIIFLHLAALVVVLARGRDQAAASRRNQEMLLTALVLMIGSELCFTLYRELSDSINILGHLYKVMAYLMLYRGIFLENVRLPIIRLDLTRRALAQAEREWQDTFDSITDPVFIHDSDHRILRCNRAYALAAGLPVDRILGRPYYQIFPRTGRPLAGCLEAHNNLKPHAEEIYVPDLERYYDNHFILVTNEKNDYRHSLHVMNDITARKRQEKELRYHATHDSLTALPNRALFLDRLHQAMARAKRNSRLVVVMLLDLDNFKAVNNSFGHATGDELLVKIADRFREALRDGDTVARLGGDEFAILLPDFEAVENATRVVEKIMATFTSPVRLANEQEIYTGASVGIACFPRDGVDEQTLMRHADLAMYHAKATGRGTWAFFDPDLDRHLHWNLQIHSRLKRALARGELTLHYQPQVEVATGTVVGLEALLRWHDPELGDMSPAHFVPIAEATGLIQHIDELVLTKACRQIAAWNRNGTPLRVAVNVSAIQFRQANFVERVGDILHATSAPPELLTIELTETAAMEDLPLARRHFEGLAGLGLRIALDDFGTGHSSLAYLKSLPVNELKIDRSFIMDIAQEEDDETIVQSVIGLAHSMNMRVVAEGVETETQLAFLRKHDCDFYQGWLCSKAVPVEEIERNFLTGAA